MAVTSSVSLGYLQKLHLTSYDNELHMQLFCDSPCANFKMKRIRWLCVCFRPFVILLIFPFLFARFSLLVFPTFLSLSFSFIFVSSLPRASHYWHRISFTLFYLFSSYNVYSKVARFVLRWWDIMKDFNLKKVAESLKLVLVSLKETMLLTTL